MGIRLFCAIPWLKNRFSRPMSRNLPSFTSLYFRGKNGTVLFLLLLFLRRRLSHAPLPPSHCETTRKIVPDGPEGIFMPLHCAPKRFKIDGRISLSSPPPSLPRGLRCQLHLLRLLQPNSSRTVSKGVSEFSPESPDRSRVLRCPSPLNNYEDGQNSLRKLRHTLKCHI